MKKKIIIGFSICVIEGKMGMGRKWAPVVVWSRE